MARIGGIASVLYFCRKMKVNMINMKGMRQGDGKQLWLQWNFQHDFSPFIDKNMGNEIKFY